jgi:hypothetical protein
MGKDMRFKADHERTWGDEGDSEKDMDGAAGARHF